MNLETLLIHPWNLFSLKVSGKYASSEGQLQSMSERLARKEKELEVVENQVEEQRKLCDGYKASAEKQEILIEKLRAEKTTSEESLLAVKLEMAKKEVTYKAGKEKVSEMQSRLYQTEDKFSSKTNELKKVGIIIQLIFTWLKYNFHEQYLNYIRTQIITPGWFCCYLPRSSGVYVCYFIFIKLYLTVKGI